MFSSNPSHASLICPSVFTSYENIDFMLSHYHLQQHGVDPLTGSILPAANHHHHHYLENMALTAYNNTTSSAEHYVDASANNLIGNKKTPAPGASKRDRHSKICTAQGFRDRRVRLSVQIARKFFDLQDMLGFDKASNTLEWLLSKSRNAIDELVELKKLPCNNKQLTMDGNAFEEKKIAKESRDKARARARQRTRDKLYYHCNNKSSSSSSQQETNSCPDDQFSARQESSSFVVAHDDQLVQEPCSRSLAAAVPHHVQRDRKEKYSSSDFAFNQLQNLEISRDAMSSNTTTSCYYTNLPHNWDIISARSRCHSTFGTVTNHEQ